MTKKRLCVLCMYYMTGTRTSAGPGSSVFNLIFYIYFVIHPVQYAV